MQTACRRQAHAPAGPDVRNQTACTADHRNLSLNTRQFPGVKGFCRAGLSSSPGRCRWHRAEGFTQLTGSLRRSQRQEKQRKSRDRNRHQFAPRAGQGEGKDSIDSTQWKSSDPYKVLNVAEDSDAEVIKAAYRNLMKEYHPDVYSGDEDANAIADRLIRAYKVLIDDDDREEIRLRKEIGPFREPVGAAASVFVNEFQCIGPRCPYSCVRKAPKTFYFADDTKRARATNRGGDDDYTIQMAVGQCPETCIHFVTEDQRLELERLMQSALLAGANPAETQYQMEMLIATANFENGRDRKPKRTVKKRDTYVDWF